MGAREGIGERRPRSVLGAGLPLVVFLVAGAVAGALAAVRPARRAARLDILAAIGVE